MTKQTIVHCIDSLRLGGAEVLLKNTLNILPQYRHVVVYLYEPNLIEPFVSPEVVFVCLCYKRKRNILRTLWRLRALVKKYKPALVHSHLFYSSLYARLATPSSVPLVFTIHSLYSIDAFRQNALSKWAEQKAIRNRHALIAVSKAAMEDYLNFVYFEGRKYVLYNFLPKNFFNKMSRRAGTGLLKCVAVGNLKEAKNYEYLIAVFEHVKNQEITLDIYGYGHLREKLEREIARRNLKIVIHEQALNIVDLLQQYDLFIQASQHEGYGLSVIEAIASGLPVFISDIPVFREITQNFAHFFPLNDSAAVAQMLMALKEDPEWRNRFVEDAYQHIRISASEEQYKKNLLGIYKSLVPYKIASCFSATAGAGQP